VHSNIRKKNSFLFFKGWVRCNSVANLCDAVCLLQAQSSGPPDVWCQLPAAVWGAAIRRKQQQLRQRLQEQRAEQSRATALLERQKAALGEAQQHAAAVGRVAALQHEQAVFQAKVAALQEQQAADQAELAALLQKQQQAEAAALRQRLQEQQDEMTATRQQAEADRGQTALLKGQVSTLQATVAALQATVTALLERQG